jgi:hypothetical protein
VIYEIGIKSRDGETVLRQYKCFIYSRSNGPRQQSYSRANGAWEIIYFIYVYLVKTACY